MAEVFGMARRARRVPRSMQWGGLATIAALAMIAALATIAGCRPRGQGTPPLCSFRTTSEAELQSQSLTPQEWLPLVSPSLDRARLVRTGPLRDTCGRVLELEPGAWAGCPGPAARVVSQPGDPVALGDLVLGQVGEGRMLVWAATEALSDGDAMGPAALVFWTEQGLDVHATGSLRGLAHEARLRLHHASGVPVVIVEGQRCAAEGACVAEAAFVPILGRRFQDLPLHDDEGRCLGRAQLELSRRLEQPIAGGLVRRFALQRTIELTDEGIFLVDLVTGDELDPGDPTATARPFRRVTTRRPLELDGDRFVVRDRDLWSHVLRDYGLVREAGGVGGGREPGEGSSDDRPDPRRSEP